jgi:5-methyltetrahydropteroyltriglutamate--homocysteine methyltransferase
LAREHILHFNNVADRLDLRIGSTHLCVNDNTATRPDFQAGDFSKHGIDVVTDGEQGKPGFFAYVRERLTGFEAKTPPAGGWKQWAAEVEAFPEYYENYFKRRMMGGSIVPRTPMVCTGPISYRGHEANRRDIENLKAALAGLQVEDAFMPAVAPSGVGSNEYYRSNEEYLHAVGDALRNEYQAIVDAGLVLQIDDPWPRKCTARIRR